MKTLRCTMCILAFSPFSAEINELKEKKTRIHIVHPSFFILQPSHERAEDEKKKLGCSLCVLASSSFSSLEELLSER